ncbi:hydroxyectoine utilization dehydratase EutB [Rhizobium hidalgonense]|uniref:Hydroxyectoine utilization dehydratase EutB n=1 Tax=Rhizobium hidalgonense TaxID=1538159 RepID=A0A2A6KJ46_9HYPH|nr:hydroxyectoine utilization dehydratase EutB [Rhizobium hidalgonense]MDR9772179.1 hydroxyectoine utilization dehydratase EutB [Rhizobium hidalgonense]MDR9810238.1 hydroxyectoine utilization dehydratase EutB [Rhizobium hidalgonense]MDR9817753.1 hydroxyectoine utilization dehydratase EutB [Rhizobium hidalgonense]PDT24906.1 hydroxyectoine utilization dehydratase EutB [Rhizobium hidalgonense]PON06064.1 hydroxyectoine utilization dehydratase EutB [Rhizobium hidalgonense]
MASTWPVSLEDIRAAARRIAGRVRVTAMAQSVSLSEIAGVPVHLKLEHHQTTGSFKLRGATNAVLSLSPAERARGIVAASTGNHGRALAYAAEAEGAVATICMSRLVPENKVSEIRRLGADVRIVGRSQDEAQQEVDRLVREVGLVMVPPFDHPAVVAGQGTLGLEIIGALQQVSTVLVPLSGGGLAAGVAAAIKGVNPKTKVIGLTMERGAAMKASLDAGRPVQVEELPSLADSLGGGIGLDNHVTFAMCRDLLDDVILLSEAEIAAGMRHAYALEREIVEGAAAVGIAALLAGKVRANGPVVAILSGRNVDMEQHRRVINGEMLFAEDGR